MIGKISKLLEYRNKVIPEDRIELFIKEKELNEFMLNYFTESKDIYAGEIRLIILKEF